MLRKILFLSTIALLTACTEQPDTSGSAHSSATASAEELTRDLEKYASDRVFFDYDSIVLSDESQRILLKQAEWLQAHPAVSILIEGHSDERGTRNYNMALGERRSTVTRDYLVNLGIDSSRIETVSFGKERPAVVGDSEDSWEKNRRAVTVIQ